MIYKNTGTGTIDLFNSNFVYSNMNKFKIIYNGKEYELSEYF